jgi:hypothetical protein
MRYQPRLTSQTSVQSNSGELFQTLSQRLKAFNNQEANELDIEMAKKAKEQGLMDAQGRTDIKLRDGTTIADENWNTGAIASHLSAIKLDITDNLTRIEGESSRDPGGYAIKAKAYSQGLLEGVPPQMQPLVKDDLAAIILKSGNKIQSDLNTFDRNQHAAKTSTAIDLYRVEGENYAKEGDIFNATDAQIKATELTNKLESAGLLTPAAAEVQRNNITRDIEDQVVYGGFDRAMVDGKGIKYISNFKSLKEFGDRDPDYRKKMVNTMIGMLGKNHEAADAETKRNNLARKERHRKGEQEVASLYLEGALITEHLQQLIEDDEISSKVAKGYFKASKLDGPEFSDQIQVNLLQEDLLKTTEFEIQSNPDISRVDKNKLVEQKRDLEADTANWRNTQSGSEGARRINQAFGIIKGVDTRISKEKAQRAGTVLTRFYNEIEALPLEERELRSIEVSDRLVKEVNGEIIVEDLQKARDRLTKAPYQTLKQIEDADLGTEENKIQIIQLERKLKKIERLEAERGQ